MTQYSMHDTVKAMGSCTFSLYIVHWFSFGADSRILTGGGGALTAVVCVTATTFYMVGKIEYIYHQIWAIEITQNTTSCNDM